MNKYQMVGLIHKLMPGIERRKVQIDVPVGRTNIVKKQRTHYRIGPYLHEHFEPRPKKRDATP